MSEEVTIKLDSANIAPPALSFSAGVGAVVTLPYEACIKCGETGKEIRFVATEAEQERIRASSEILTTWFEILAARYGDR